MKKFILILILFISLKADSQIQRYKSYQSYYTEADYTEKFEDTSKIVIQHGSNYKLLIISNKNLLEFFPIYDKTEYNGVLGLKSIYYNVFENKIPVKIEFTYDSGLLIQISIIRLNNISTYIIIKSEEYL
jgi:hypothetical protein